MLFHGALMEFQSKARGKRKGKRRALKKREKTLFFSSPYDCSAEAALHWRSGVSFTENTHFKRRRRKRAWASLTTAARAAWAFPL